MADNESTSVTKDLGIVSAYGYAKAAGYTGTEEEFEQIFLEFTENAPGLLDRLDDAVDAAEDAESAAVSAKNTAVDAKDAAVAAAATFETDTTLAVSGKAADAKVTGDEITGLKTAIGSYSEAPTFYTDTYAWSTIGNTSYPYGWEKGYYRQSDGAYTTSNKYACTISKIHIDADRIVITPPNGYGLTVSIWDNVGTYVETKGSTSNTNQPITLDINRTYFYAFNIGAFSNNDAPTYVQNENFINSILLKKYVFISKEFEREDSYVFDWDDISSVSYAYGWRTGYYKATDGTRSTSNKYICVAKKIRFAADKVIITPPTGYYITACEYGIDRQFIRSMGSSSDVSKPLEITTNRDYYYAFSIGQFSNSDAQTYAENEDFVNSIVLRVYVDAVKLSDAVQGLTDTKADLLNASMSMYDSFGVCGASWDCGYYYIGNASYTNNDLSWGENLAKRNGNTFNCFASASLYTKTWLSSEYGLTALLAADPCGLYILTFGGNDSEQGSEYLGSITDITSHESYTDYPDTFYGNYGKIIEQIQEYAPKAMIICIMEYNPNIHTAIRGTYFDAGTEIAEHYGIPRLNWASDRWYESSFMKDNLVHAHPTPVQYSGIAGAWERLYSKCVVDNYDYFKTYNP